MSKRIFTWLSCVLVLSCAKPTDPESLIPGTGGYTVVGKLVTPGFAQDIEVRDTLVYVAEGEGGVAIVSVANPVNPRLVSVCQQGVRGYAYKLALMDSIVYLAAGGFGLNTANVGNPYAPYFVANYAGASSTSDVEIFGTWLLEGKGEKGVRFGDLAEIAAGYMNPKGTIVCPGYAHGMASTLDSSLLIACGEMGVAMYDLRDIGRTEGYYDESKEYYSWIDLPGYAVDVTTMGNQPIAFVACGTAGVWVVDFSDPASIKAVGSYTTGGYAKEVAYNNGRLYVTTELRGLQILAVENPVSPRLVGVVDTEYALGLAVDQRYVYVADQTDGLIVIAIPPY
jgi:hypothetical protein